MLPTLLFILWAYGMYALFTVISQRKGGHYRQRSRWSRLGWVTLAGGIGAGLALLLWLIFSPDRENQHLQLTGFLGTVYAEGWPAQADRPLEYPPVKTATPTAGNQPVYALLHPETPASQMEPEKKAPKPRPARKAKSEKTSAPPGKGLKAGTPAAKKEKAATKSKAKKKKSASSPAANKTPTG